MITTINRLQIQNNNEKKEIIDYLRKEVLKKYPKFYKDDAFVKIPKNRQIIARLNAAGLSSVSDMLLKLKEKLH